MHNRSLLQERVVNSLVVDGRRLWSAVGAIMAHDILALHYRNLPRVYDHAADVTLAVSLTSIGQRYQRPSRRYFWILWTMFDVQLQWIT